ncbi:hypothetical protein FPZ42_07635 [Mucilaginibacter achroorhodeus]|uniref:Uncharacterized protein n=1 Tax=Mucilaginibacter achroorhodeus TaxID=2599294 RepID=A0A563U6B6_9SPHI|nr:hypothetical protein [Mucilaginibacter achroorhodeus]TWR26897.1 hypothetical protein FPZ42_07635 [Mucilaginibacter achroorhodeus]
MRKIQFLTVQELIDSSPVQTNVDEKILNQSILEFQELELEQILGKSLYQRLNNVLVSGATIDDYTYSVADEMLFAKIKPVMLYGALLYSLAPLHFKITNKGIQKLTDTNSQTGDRTDIESLRASYTFKLDRYKALLVDYLANDDDPDTNAQCDIDTSFGISGIAIPDNSFNEDEYYKSSAYKTGYYRRFIY